MAWCFPLKIWRRKGSSDNSWLKSAPFFPGFQEIYRDLSILRTELHRLGLISHRRSFALLSAVFCQDSQVLFFSYRVPEKTTMPLAQNNFYQIGEDTIRKIASMISCASLSIVEGGTLEQF